MVTEVKSTIDGVQGDGKTVKPPYISYTTLKNLLTWLEKEGVPLRFDRSFWSTKFSGSIGPQLMNGMRFLGLLDGEKPVASLDTLVTARGEDRKQAMREVLQRAYGNVKFEELPRATPAMFKDWFKSYDIDGNTVRKAESFFINAAKDNDIPMSNALKKLARNRVSGSSASTQRGRKPKEGTESAADDYPNDNQEVKPKPPAATDRQASVKTVKLHGATVALSVATADLIELAAFPEELKWFQELLVKFNERAGPKLE